MHTRARARTAASHTLRRNARQRKRQRHLGAVGLHQLPLALLRLAPRLTGGDCAALGSDLLQLRVHQTGAAEPVAYGEHGHHDPKA